MRKDNEHLFRADITSTWDKIEQKPEYDGVKGQNK